MESMRRFRSLWKKKPKNNRRSIFFSQFIVPKRIFKNSLLISISWCARYNAQLFCIRRPKAHLVAIFSLEKQMGCCYIKAQCERCSPRIPNDTKDLSVWHTLTCLYICLDVLLLYYTDLFVLSFSFSFFTDFVCIRMIGIGSFFL